MERKLAAILAADVVGNSRLMQRDEESTLDALRSHREVVYGLIAARRGRVFNRVGKAINPVIEIPQEASERNDCVPACGSSSRISLGIARLRGQRATVVVDRIDLEAG